MFVFPIIALVSIWLHMCLPETGLVRFSLNWVGISNNKFVYRFKNKKIKKQAKQKIKTDIHLSEYQKGKRLWAIWSYNKRKAHQLIAGGRTSVKDLPRLWFLKLLVINSNFIQVWCNLNFYTFFFTSLGTSPLSLKNVGD